jgi:gamma-glutamyltranspeptidase/glutathione hydrolase
MYSRLLQVVSLALLLLVAAPGLSARTAKPVLHGSHWVAITGKPLAATAGAAIFQKGGNAVDAACAMLGATSTMWDVLAWGGETQALIFNPNTGKVLGINALGVAPTGATPEYFHQQGLLYPPRFGPLSAVTPGTPGGLMVMLAEYGTMSLAEVLAPSIEMARGYPMDAETSNAIERRKEYIREWPYSREVFLVHARDDDQLPGEKAEAGSHLDLTLSKFDPGTQRPNAANAGREAPHPGEIFVQSDLAETLEKLVEAEAQALADGKDRRSAIYAAYDRFYRGDIAREFVRSSREMGGLHTLADLSDWEVYIEEPVSVNYKGIDVYKLTTWVQGPVMLQALNMLEEIDLKSMGYNSARYIHTLYQAMNLAYADRDFYYGDPYFPPEEPVAGLLSDSYAADRRRLIGDGINNADARPGDPYPHQGEENPFMEYLDAWRSVRPGEVDIAMAESDFFRGTTSIQAADKEGWVVSVTPSGGWIPAVIAGRTGIGMSQRMQSFVLDPADNPYNVLEPGKRPRATLTPGLALKQGEPYLSFAVQGGDMQDQALLQMFLNIVEFGMNVQEAAEAPNIVSFQMRDSFGQHESFPGKIYLREDMPAWVQEELKTRGYNIELQSLTSGPINAIFFDREHGSFWGGSSNFGEDYGLAW